MFPLLRRASSPAVPMTFQRYPSRNLHRRSISWRHGRQFQKTLLVSTSRPVGSRIIARDNFFLVPPAAAFSTETDLGNDNDDAEDLAMAISVPSKETVSRKDEILNGFLQDLPILRDEIFSCLEDELVEKAKDEQDGVEISLKTTPRQGYEGALAQHNHRKRPRGVLMGASFDLDTTFWTDHSNRNTLFSPNGKPLSNDLLLSRSSEADVSNDLRLSSWNDIASDFETELVHGVGIHNWPQQASIADASVVDQPAAVLSMPNDDLGLSAQGAPFLDTRFSPLPDITSQQELHSPSEPESDFFSDEPLAPALESNGSTLSDCPKLSSSNWEGVNIEEGVAYQIQEELSKVCLQFESLTRDHWKLVDGDSNHDLEDIGTVEPHETNAIATQIEQLRFVLEPSLLHSRALSTADYNLILARVATATELSLDAIMENLLEIYHLMTKYAPPDETTYKILLLTLERRIGPSSDATMATLLQDMINFNVKLSSGTLLNLGIECLDRENKVEVARRLIVDYALGDKERTFRVPRKAIKALMKMFARENQLREAIDLLEKCAEENGKSSGETDAVFDAALRWPDHNRAGRRRDITHVLQSFLEVLTKDHRDYRPSFSVYRNLIVALSRTTKGDVTRWEKLRAPFHALFNNYPRYYPDEMLLRVGLNYCEATADSHLALNFVSRLVDQHAPLSRIGSTKDDFFATITAEMFSGYETESGVYTDNGFQYGMQPGSGSGDLGTFLTEISAEPNTAASRFSSLGTSVSGVNSDSAPSSRLPAAAETSVADKGSGNADADISTSKGNEIETATLFGNAAVCDELGMGKVNQPPFSHKIFQRALKVCLAADDLPSSRKILDAYSRIGNLYPKKIESDIWNFVVRGFASLGHDHDAIQGLFNEMKSKHMKISEETYGAIIHGLAVGNPDEAAALFRDLQMESRETGVTAGVSCYNAIIFSHIKAKAWRQVLCCYDELKAAGLKPNGSTTQSLFIASYREGGTDHARRLMKEILALNVAINRENCHLALKILMPEVLKQCKSASTADIQSILRTMGDVDESLRSACLNLLRSMRQADIEHNRLPTRHAPLEVLSKRREEAWHATLRDILDLDQVRMQSPRPPSPLVHRMELPS